MRIARSSQLLALALAAALALVAAPAAGQAPPAQIDAVARKAVVDAAAQRLRERYVFPETGARAADAIEAALASGAYDNLTDPRAFAERLTADLAKIARDKHLAVRAMLPGPPPAGGPQPPPPSEGGIVRADRLAGGVGYIEIVAFPPPALFKASLDGALAKLAPSKALIFDLRRNHGGSPQSVAYLVSHFVDPAKPMLINDFQNRKPGTAEYTHQPSMTVPTPISLRGKPVFVLTSAGTFSGGEEFAYDIQAFHLGKLVGETTGGGANPGGGGPLAAGFGMFTPTGRPVNPMTKTNWEGVGVKPDLAVPAPDALRAALQQLGQAPSSGDIAALSQVRLFTPRTTAQPGGERIARLLAEGLARGEPPYELMDTQTAAITRDQLPGLKSFFGALGHIETVSFAGLDPIGVDSYDVRGSTGAARVILWLDPAGKVAFSGVMPAPPATR